MLKCYKLGIIPTNLEKILLNGLIKNFSNKKYIQMKIQRFHVLVNYVLDFFKYKF